MRASLVSATSLLALLLVDEGLSYASTISVSSSNLTEFFLLNGVGSVSGTELITVSGATGGNSTLNITPTSQNGFTVSPTSTTITSGVSQTVNATATFNFSSLTAASFSSTFTASDPAGSGTGSAKFTVTASAAAPLASVAASSALNILVGNTGTATITVSNVGNGNLFSKTAAGANLVGTIGTASSVFTGSAKPFTLNDTNFGASSTISTTQAFTFSPTVRGSSSATVVTQLASGSNASNQAGSVSTILTAKGVAPVGALSTSSTNYFLVGQAGTATVTATNSGDGNLSGLGTISNFRGSLAAASGGFAGVAHSISLGDTSSTSFSYTFAPTARGQTASALVVASLSNGSANGTNGTSSPTITLTGTGVAPVLSVASTSNTTQFVRIGTSATSSITVSNIGNGNLATGRPSSVSNLNFSVAPTLGSGFSASSVNQTSYSLADSTSGAAVATSSTLAYTYTPTSHTSSGSATVALAFSDGSANGSNTGGTVSSVFNARGVGPTYNSPSYGTSSSGSSLAGSITNISTPTASPNGAIGAAGATISFGSVGYAKSETLYLLLKNTTTDTNAAGALTNLTIERYSIAGTGAYEFHPSLTANSVISEGGQLLLPITLISSGGGALNSSLTIFTDESAALGGTGDTFTYTLTAFAVPEPATIAVLGAGLAGLAGIRRRRKQAAKQ